MKTLAKKIIINILVNISKIILKRYKPIIIGITGNLGKTSTKDSVYHFIKNFVDVRASYKSENSEWGVPLTIIGGRSGYGSILGWLKVILKGLVTIVYSKYPKVLILEIGADHKGDIENFSKWIKLDIGIVTQFGTTPVHIENYNNREELVREKGFLVEAIKNKGVFIYNHDDNDGARLQTRNKNLGEIYSVGFSEGSTVRGESVNIYDKELSAATANVYYDNKKYDLMARGIAGVSFIYSVLPAFIVAKYFKLNIEECVDYYNEHMEYPNGRMKVLKGMNNTTLIDDTYNASPLAMAHGLKVLANFEGRRIAVLGDMLELGIHTEKEHRLIGKQLHKCADIVMCVGVRARFIAMAARDNGMSDDQVYEADNVMEAIKDIARIIKEGDVIYIKGSQGVRLEKLTKILLDKSIDAKDVLVRQEQEWLRS